MVQLHPKPAECSPLILAVDPSFPSQGTEVTRTRKSKEINRKLFILVMLG